MNVKLKRHYKANSGVTKLRGDALRESCNHQKETKGRSRTHHQGNDKRWVSLKIEGRPSFAKGGGAEEMLRGRCFAKGGSRTGT